MINKHSFKDFMIVDREEVILYGDIGNPQYFDTDVKRIRGKRLNQLYRDIDGEYPALKAARDGSYADYFDIDIETTGGVCLKKVGCTYPIFCGVEPVAAIEFSDLLYGKENIGEATGHWDHLIYRKNNTRYLLDDIISGDEKLCRIKKDIEKYAISDSTVLIYGETGTGKELAAQALHNSGRRFSKSFVSFNCSAIPENLLESILFGTTRGSYTGAEDKEGLFEQAEGGTLFLDEINSLSPFLQVKLLKAVETKRIRRIGSDREVRVDARIVAAANEEPALLIREGRMIPDLYFRLSVVYIRLPRLIERGGDVLLLANYFIDSFNKRMGTEIEPIRADSEIAALFLTYSWPGNIRELRNVIEGAFAFAGNNRITMQEIPPYIIKKCGSGLPETPSYDKRISLRENISAVEQKILLHEYESCGGNLTRVAERLNISKQLLKYKINKYTRGASVNILTGAEEDKWV